MGSDNERRKTVTKRHGAGSDEQQETSVKLTDVAVLIVLSAQS